MTVAVAVAARAVALGDGAVGVAGAATRDGSRFFGVGLIANAMTTMPTATATIAISSHNDKRRGPRARVVVTRGVSARTAGG